MNRKRTADVIICCICVAIIILCYTYIEQDDLKRIIYAVCGLIILLFAVLAVLDSEQKKNRHKIQFKRGIIQEVVLLDEEGGEVTTWDIGGKTSVLIGRDTHKENVDINLHNTEYGGMVDRQHAVLNYAGGQWYIEDLGSKNGVRLQKGRDDAIYQISKSHLCRVDKWDIIYIGNTKLQVR